jgi:hypothetical protein
LRRLRLALAFLPMAILMIGSSLLAGRWTAVAGPRQSITIGGVLLAAGVFRTDVYVSPHPDQGLLVAALALAPKGP